MKIKPFLLLSLSVLLLLSALFSPVTRAGTIGFDEGASAQGGTLSYDGIGGPLIGSSIDFTTILGTATPANAGTTLVCTTCKLNFSTGANLVEGPAQWQFAPGGSIGISGVAQGVAAGILAAGSFNQQSTVIGGGGNALFVGVGSNTFAGPLSAYFGYVATAAFEYAQSTISLGNCQGFANGGFSCAIDNADFNANAVPEPGPVGLMGAGLLALGLVGIRRRKEV